MTNRERIRNCIQNKPIDRAPYVSFFGPWPETEERWKKETGENFDYSYSAFGTDAGIVSVNAHVWAGPTFTHEVLEHGGGKVIYRTVLGTVEESIDGQSNIPRIISNPVTCREDWERFKAKRLDPDNPARFAENWEEIADALNNGEAAVQLGMFPFGLFGTLRDMMGVELLLVTFYDDPELIHDIMSYLTDFWIKIYTKVCERVKPDILHIWEDMSGKQGPLISPAMIREFMTPYYKKLRAFADSVGCAGLMVDTDGRCDELIPPLMEGGMNFLVPFEVAAGSDVLAFKRQYPKLCMMGGIDKRRLFGGCDEIDKELARIEPLLCGSGYIPALDHSIPPEISWDNFCYYMTQLKKMIYKNGQGT